MLTSQEIEYLIRKISRRIVVAETLEFPFEITEVRPGYAIDPMDIRIEGKLRIMADRACEAEFERER